MSEVFWNLQLKVNEGQLDNFKALAEEMSAATNENEPGALVYEWNFNGHDCHLMEGYVDDDAAMVHIGNFGANFAERFLGMCAVTGLDVYAQPGDEVRAALDGMGAVYYEGGIGFTRALSAEE